MLSATLTKFLVVVSVFFVAALAVISLRHLSFSKGVFNPGPYFNMLYLEIGVMILPGVLLIHFGSFREIWAFSGVAEEDWFPSSMWICYGLSVFLIALVTLEKVTEKVFGKVVFPRKIEDGNLIIIVLVVVQVVLLLIILASVGSFPVLGLFHGAEVGVLRKQATTLYMGSRLPHAFLETVANFSMVYLGLISARRQRPRLFWWLAFISLFSLSWYAAKSPIVVGLMLFFFAKSWAGAKRIPFLKLLGFIVLVVTASVLIFFALLPDWSNREIVEYFIVRTFLLQISGFYQALSVIDPDLSYARAWFPLSSFLFGDEVTVFSRSLMVMTEGDTMTNGQKNSVFMHEAYGALGTLGLLVSPIWAAIMLIVGIRVIAVVVGRLVGRIYGQAAVFFFIFSFHITGGFISIAFLRGAIYPLVILGFIGGIYQVLFYSVGRRRRVYRENVVKT